MHEAGTDRAPRVVAAENCTAGAERAINPRILSKRGNPGACFLFLASTVAGEEKAGAFCLIADQPASESTSSSIELVLAGGDRLHIPNDAAILRMVLSILRESKTV